MAAPVRGISALLLVAVVAAGGVAAIFGGRASPVTAPAPNLVPQPQVEREIADAIDTARSFIHSGCGTPVGYAANHLVLLGPAVVPHMVGLLESDADEDVALHGFALDVLYSLGETELSTTWCKRRPGLRDCGERDPDELSWTSHSLSRPRGSWGGDMWIDGQRQPVALRASESDPLRLAFCVGPKCRRSVWVTRTGARMSAQLGGEILTVVTGARGDYITGWYGGNWLRLDRYGPSYSLRAVPLDD